MNHAVPPTQSEKLEHWDAQCSSTNERIHLLNTAWAAFVLLAVLGTSYVIIGVTGRGLVPLAIGILILGLAAAVFRLETAR